MISLKTKISTPHLDETRAFYQQLFDMVEVESWEEPDDVGCILAFGEPPREAYLEIYLDDDLEAFTGLSLQFRVDDLDAFLEIVPPEISYQGPTPRPWGSTYVYFRDPNGIQVIVYTGGL